MSKILRVFRGAIVYAFSNCELVSSLVSFLTHEEICLLDVFNFRLPSSSVPVVAKKAGLARDQFGEAGCTY